VSVRLLERSNGGHDNTVSLINPIIIPHAICDNEKTCLWREQNKERRYLVNRPESSSEVARLRERIQLEYEAAQRGLSGIAQGTAQHAFITRRLENMAEHHRELEQLVGEQEATSILKEVLEQSH